MKVALILVAIISIAYGAEPFDTLCKPLTVESQCKAQVYCQYDTGKKSCSAKSDASYCNSATTSQLCAVMKAAFPATCKLLTQEKLCADVCTWSKSTNCTVNASAACSWSTNKCVKGAASNALNNISLTMGMFLITLMSYLF
jgi:hypothetical protein